MARALMALMRPSCFVPVSHDLPNFHLNLGLRVPLPLPLNVGLKVPLPLHRPLTPTAAASSFAASHLEWPEL